MLDSIAKHLMLVVQLIVLLLTVIVRVVMVMGCCQALHTVDFLWQVEDFLLDGLAFLVGVCRASVNAYFD